MLEATMDALQEPASSESMLRRQGLASASDSNLWATFGAARSAHEFCASWLSIQCRSIQGSRTALLLLQEDDGRYATVATWPDDDRDLSYLAPAAQSALVQRKGLVVQPSAEDAAAGRNGCTLAYPIDVGGDLKGVAVLDLGPRTAAELPKLMRQVHWGAGWLETLFRRQQVEQTSAQEARTSFALDILAGASEHRPLQAAAIDVVNALAIRLACRRVSLGLVRRNSIRLTAISHSAVFHEKTHVVASIENAMEEALDQRRSVSVPETPSTARRTAIAHADLAKAAGAQSVISVLMTGAGRPVGVLTLERDRGDTFDARDIQLLEAAAAMLGPLFELKVDANRLIAGRAVGGARGTFAALLGRRHPALKLAAIVTAAGLTAITVVPAPFRVSAKAVVEGSIQRAAVAPFDGYIASATARAGDTVAKGQVLATLDDQDLKLEALRWRSDAQQQRAKFDDAMGKHDRAALRIAEASVDELQAQIALVEDKLARSAVTAPFAAVVVSGDLSQTIGSPVEKGKVLFELAPLDAYRVALAVDERDIELVKPGLAGEMILTGLAGERFPFTVKTITPVATAADGRTTFRVEAAIDNASGALRPGMEGIGKVSIDRRSLLSIWARPLIDWARIELWTLWP